MYNCSDSSDDALFMNLFSNKTFRQKKSAPMSQLKQIADSSIESGNLKLAVQLPPGEDLDEWLAVNTVDFFNQINILYGAITEFCTPISCPLMTAGPKYEYLWAVQYKKPVKLSAPEYVDQLMSWIQSQLDNETIFPTRIGVPFQKNFIAYIKTIFKRLFRVYAHIYILHYEKIVELEVDAHLNTSFKHFMFFVTEFKLVPQNELAPMESMISGFLQKS